MAKQGQISPAWIEEAQALITRLVILKGEAFRLGLLRTAHAMDTATQKVGWELADILEGRQACIAAVPKRRAK